MSDWVWLVVVGVVIAIIFGAEGLVDWFRRREPR